jgi:CDGSH-type Zn-finger protein
MHESNESTAAAVTIRCREHGPLVVELPPGVDLRVNDHEGRAFPLPTHKRVVALCRCGHSATRPFCDGSHRTCGFSAAETAPEAPPDSCVPR